MSVSFIPRIYFVINENTLFPTYVTISSSSLPDCFSYRVPNIKSL